MMQQHPLDRALALQPAEGAPGTWHGATTPDYWNMVGPFGGTTAATALQAILLHPALLGEPVALTVNFAAAVAEGGFTVQAVPVRTNRSTQHWSVTLVQRDANGEEQVATTATAVTAVRRETWSRNDVPMPALAFADGLQRMRFSEVAWTGSYDLRLVHGAVPAVWDGSGTDSLTQLWVRDEPPRPLDFPALAALADVFYPRVWLRRATRVPAGTVSITTYFHAGGAELAAVGTGHLLGQARGQTFGNGYFDQTAQLWSQAGVMLATSHQIVYFKN